MEFHGAVADRAIFHHEVAAEFCECARYGECIEFERECVAFAQDADVGIYAALAIEPETATELVISEVFEFLGKHAVEEAGGIAAGDFEDAAVGEVEDDAGAAEGCVFEGEFAVGCDYGNDAGSGCTELTLRVGNAVVGEHCAGGGVEVVDGGFEGHSWHMSKGTIMVSSLWRRQRTSLLIAVAGAAN